jgi:pimeloyl-ACP methyl ester carboxylesterase
MKRPRLILSILLAIALLAALGMAGLGWAGSSRLISPPRRTLQDYHLQTLADPAGYGLQIQKYTGPSNTPCLLVTAAPSPGAAKKSNALRAELERRRVALPPWNSTSATIMMLHGLSGRKEDFLPICERFCAAGFRCIIPDLPAQGDNPAPFATFGKAEAPLISDLMQDAAKRFTFPPAPAFLFGVSQGGAIAFQTAALRPAQWTGVVSVAAFASLDVPVNVSVRENLPASLRFLSPIVSVGVFSGAKYRAGFWPGDIRPVDAAAKLHLPVFIAHGSDDHMIPVDEARRLFAALPDSRKTFRVVSGANHYTVLGKESDTLYADICEFYLKTLVDLHPVTERTE